MHPSSPDATTPFDAATPRRAALRTLGAVGAAALGAIGLQATAPARTKKQRHGGRTAKKRHDASAEKKKHKNKQGCTCPTPTISQASSDAFSVGAGTNVTETAPCPPNAKAISGGLRGDTPLGVDCQIAESFPSADGQAWNVNVFCAQNSPNVRVVAVCLSTS